MTQASELTEELAACSMAAEAVVDRLFYVVMELIPRVPDYELAKATRYNALPGLVLKLPRLRRVRKLAGLHSRRDHDRRPVQRRRTRRERRCSAASSPLDEGYRRDRETYSGRGCGTVRHFGDFELVF